MEDLIEDLLTLAHEGDAVSDFEPVNLGELAENCWANVRTVDATLATCADCDIYADESRLKQALENLVRNAVEHGGDGVRMVIGELDDGFYIEDDGLGIPEDNRDDVFNVGFSTNEGGAGFGLSIVKRIVEAHGWEICITESSEGGTRFEITGVEFAVSSTRLLTASVKVELGRAEYRALISHRGIAVSRTGNRSIQRPCCTA